MLLVGVIGYEVGVVHGVGGGVYSACRRRLTSQSAADERYILEFAAQAPGRGGRGTLSNS